MSQPFGVWSAAGEVMEPRSQIPVFQDLAAALGFIVGRLDAQDLNALAAAGEKASAESDGRALEELRRRHDQQRLEVVFAGRSFPKDATRYKLGGHGVELGHIHIDFRYRDDGWVLEDIFICR
jgi:hypothetical protein